MRAIAQRVVVLDGEVVEAGPTGQVLGHPAADHARRLLADAPRLEAGGGRG
ncbi:hypothetical protein [uncultured Jatrophihabitans sp.]|uniref:hypothetical protein n=1 Tax=uncultured Jatrophihabitans sp. TaxID=1610747 RepID=UPI0035CC4BE4